MKYILLIFTLGYLATACLRLPSPDAPVLQSQNQTLPSALQGNYTEKLRVGNQTIFVEIATTPGEQQQGLSGREALTDNEGMLFDFRPTPPSLPLPRGGIKNNSPPYQGGVEGGLRPGFWMKDMKFSLDLIWIKNQTIIAITKNVPYPKNGAAQLPLYYPPSAIDSVLEVNAGWTDRHQIVVGDEVKF